MRRETDETSIKVGEKQDAKYSEQLQERMMTWRI